MELDKVKMVNVYFVSTDFYTLSGRLPTFHIIIFSALQPGQLSKGLKKDRPGLREILLWPISIDLKMERKPRLG